MERLRSKAYGDAPLNVNEEVWKAVLDREQNAEMNGEEGEELVDDESEEEFEHDIDDGEWGDREFVSDVSGDEEDGLSDLEDIVVCSINYASETLVLI